VNRWASFGAAMLAVTALSGCLASEVGPPAGTGRLRFRDEVFSSMTTTSKLTYGSAPGLDGRPVTLKLDLHEPAGDTVATRPAIVYVHGGAFSSGSRAEGATEMAPMVRRGFVVASISYRLLAPAGCSGASTGDAYAACHDAAYAAMDDARAAVRWLRANAATYRIDTSRIAIEGYSAGGVTAAGVGLVSEEPGSSGNPGHSSAVRAWVSIAGGVPGGAGASPGDPPGYLFSGTADPVVPHQWSVDTARALHEAGGFAVFKPKVGGGHGLPDMAMVTQQTANFYYFTMDLGSSPT
jgi:acetyl esterase/lipase